MAVDVGCALAAVHQVLRMYCHVEVLGSVPGLGEIYVDDSISSACPSH